MLEILPKPSPADKDSQVRFFRTPEEELEYGDCWHLYGEIAKFFDCTKAYATNILSAGVTKSTDDEEDGNSKRLTAPSCSYAMYINGEIDVAVYGVVEPCKGFFWTENERSFVSLLGKKVRDWRQRGYVCYADDKKACDFARQKMQEGLIQKQ